MVAPTEVRVGWVRTASYGRFRPDYWPLERRQGAGQRPLAGQLVNSIPLS